MEGKLILSFVLLAVFIESAKATCPSKSSVLPGGCWRNWRSQCKRNYHCPVGQECCAVQWCWGLKYCRKPINPIQVPVQVNTNNKANTVGVSITPIVNKPVQQQAVPAVAAPVQQQAVPNVNTQAQQQAVETRPGRCDRNKECTGNRCTQDGDCPPAKKCCLNACGARTCAPILRSSVFFGRRK